jgi:release factor glutamine methyltransferase
LFDRFKLEEPFEYLVNNSCFYGFDFCVDNRVLIPRNDTEIMVSECLNEIKSNYIEKFILLDI